MLSCNIKTKDSMTDTATGGNITTNNANNSLASLESPEQVTSLLQAVKLLVDLANADYGSTAACSFCSTALNKACCNHESQNALILELKCAIERLLSTCRILQQEADSHLHEMHRLNEQRVESNSRIATLEKAVKKLYKRNQVLKQTMQHDKETMTRQVEQYVYETNQQHQKQQVLAHERLLKLESHSTRDCDDESCASSVSTMASCITDDGIATVCYDSPCPPSAKEATTRSHSTEEYTLQFPQGTKIGLQFCKMELETTRGLLNSAIQDCNEACVTTTPTKESSFRHFKIRGKHHDEQHEYAYVVCGHYGFDCDLNTAPSLGAHLKKVNGEWTSKMSLDKIRAAMQSNKREFFSLTFRNEFLGKQQDEMLKCAVQVTQQQYQDANESKGQVRSVCAGGGETEQQYKYKPNIICLHDEGGPLRFSSFLHGARSRTLSDGAVRADVASKGSAEKEASSNKQNVVVSPSTKSFYSILHGSDKIDQGMTVESNLSNSERESSLSEDDVIASSGSASRFASIFSRGRTFSDNNVMSPGEEENSVHSELSHDKEVSPSGRSFYSILHGDTNAASSSDVDATSASRPNDDVPSSGSEGDEGEYKDADDVDETLDSDSRMSLLFNSVRRRAFSETIDELGDPPSSEQETKATDGHTETPETPRKRLSSFIMGGSRNRVDSDPVDSENTDDTAESAVAASPLPHLAEESSPTGASGKFHTGIKSMGSRFKSWAPAAGKST